jgi:predicted ATP-dependent endonuclease of OLD family
MPSNNSTLPLTQFAIYGLYGERNVVVPFNHLAKILVSENGVGKTTILNAFYTALTCQFFKLATLDFKKIVLTFPHDEITIRKSDLVQNNEEENNDIYKEIKQKLLDIDFIALMDLSREFPLEKLMEHPRLQSAAKALKIPTRFLATQFRNFSTGREEGELLATSERIKSLFNYKVIYFPTFRRIEENLSNLGYFSTSPNALLQSGMSDVDAEIEQMTLDIKELVIGWTLATNEQLFTQVVKDMKFFENADRNIDSLEYSKIAMEHIGETLKSIDFSKFDGLEPSTVEDFFSNTVQTYRQEQKKQNAIKAFINVCNRYLVDKQFVYNDKQVEIDIVLTKNDHPITLEQLSSGEKQIVSIFSKLYLGSSPKNVVLFDEPELSISMEWQKMLLPDVLNSPQCHGVIAATHSPFIFDNDLITYTVALNEYIEEI